MNRRHYRCLIVISVSQLALGSMTRQAIAIPPFAQQTRMPCTACHIGGYGPQLTPFGRAFKIGGYTQTGGDGWATHLPLAVMAITSFNQTSAAFPPDQVPHHYASNNNISLDQVSGFVGGNLGEHSGGFMQFTWSDVDNTSYVDDVDLRPYTTVVTLGGKDLRIGTTLNNTPTIQDPFNTTFAWGFPYIASALAPGPSADPILSGALAGNAIGYTAYAWYDNRLYLEAGAYNTLGPWTLARFGNDYVIGSTTEPAPYLRAAYEWQWGESAAHVGALFLHASVNPATGVPYQTSATNGTDRYTDYAFDGGYQFLGDGTHIFTAQGIFTHEDQNLRATAANSGFGAQYGLNQIRTNVSYWHQNTYGVTLGWQKSWGPANPLLYPQAGLTGSANNKPDSNAFTIEADWVPFGKDTSFAAPFLNLKLGVQYVAYTQFNGGSTNYDGAGRNASDNNTLLLFAWMIF